MNKMIAVLVLLASVVVPSVSSAALSCAYDGVAIGYYQCYDGRLSGFFEATFGDTSGYWVMLDNQSVNDNTNLTGTVTLFPGDTSATKYVNPVLYARAGWLIDFTFSEMSFPMPTDAAAQLNAAIWNIFEPGSVPLYTANGDAYDINFMYQQDIAGAGDNFNRAQFVWFLTALNGNEAIVLSSISPPPPTSAPSVPIPPSVWLFASGLAGMVRIMRRHSKMS